MNNPIHKLSFFVVAEMWKCFFDFSAAFSFNINIIGTFCYPAGGEGVPRPSLRLSIHFVLYKWLSYNKLISYHIETKPSPINYLTN